jgi:hypothetical protein
LSFNPLSEVRYRYRLAVEQLERAETLFSLEDWVGTVSCMHVEEAKNDAGRLMEEGCRISEEVSNEFCTLLGLKGSR